MRPIERAALSQSRRYFVLNSGVVVLEAHNEREAVAEYERLLGLGWPATKSASVYSADSRQQLEDYLADRVRLVRLGVGNGYWESPEGQAQREAYRLEAPA